MTLLIALLLSLGTTFSTDYTSEVNREPQGESIGLGQNNSSGIENEQSYILTDIDGM